MPTHYDGTPKERRALDAWIKLNRAVDSVGTHLTDALTTEGMSHAHLGVLEALRFVGPMCQADLARKLLRSGANMTELIDALEEQGFVGRQRDLKDRRRFQVTLTASGKRAIDLAFPSHARRISEAFAALTAAEQLELGRLCKKLGLSNTKHKEKTT